MHKTKWTHPSRCGPCLAARCSRSGFRFQRTPPANSTLRRERSSSRVHRVRQSAFHPRQSQRTVRTSQQPNLLNFIEQNGTLDAGDRTVLISHTANDIMTTETGCCFGRRWDLHRQQLPGVQPREQAGEYLFSVLLLLLDRPGFGHHTEECGQHLRTDHT